MNEIVVGRITQLTNGGDLSFSGAVSAVNAVITSEQLIKGLKRYLEQYEITTEHDSSMSNVIEWLENCAPDSP